MSVGVGDRIRELRIISGMSQDELGRRVGVQRAAINKYELGTVTNIPLSTIEKIADTFEVSPVYLVGWDDRYSNPLSAESKIIKGVQTFFGKDAVEILELYMNMSDIGKKRFLLYANDLSKLYSQDM